MKTIDIFSLDVYDYLISNLLDQLQLFFCPRRNKIYRAYSTFRLLSL